jgi:NADH-quinone oxidoreductase subunit C
MAQSLIDLLRETHADAVASAHSEKGDEVVTVPRERLVEVCRFLKDDPRTELKLLAQIACVDLLTYANEATGGAALASIEVPAYDLAHVRPVEPRFRVAYNLGSVTKKHRLRLRVELRSDDVKVPTVTGIWRTADWWERYIYDMFGVEFVGHANLTRIMMYPEFQGHPLRKDYPVRKRQPLVPELDFPDLVRGPGPGPGGAGVPMSQTHVGRGSVDPDAYD